MTTTTQRNKLSCANKLSASDLKFHYEQAQAVTSSPEAQ